MKIPPLRKYSPFVLLVLFSLAASATMTFFVPAFRNTLIQELSSSNAPDSIAQRRQPPADSLFNQLISMADQYLKEKKPEKCLTELEKAQKIRPYDPVLKDRIMKTKALLNDSRAKTAEYQKAMSAGDQYFSTKDYINAKAYYQMALGQLPEDTAATRKLKKTMEMLRASKARNILYDVAVASADRLFQEKEYERARIEYENAGKILPDEQYPKTKINEIIKIQVDHQAIEEEYTLSVTAADKFFGIKAYAPALKEYKKANTIKPQEKYPLDRIAELTAIINAQQAKEDAYNKAIAGADLLFKKIQLQDARKGYQQALTIKPEEQYPKDKIVEIEALIARSTKEKEEYERYITLADSLYIEKQYLQAKQNYQLAATVKPKENYPREMINKSDQMIAGQDDALMKSINDQYSNAITEGDKLLAARQYSKSQTAFRKANGLKPLEQYPKEKLTELEGLILDDNYSAAIKKGDSLLAGLTYQGALDAYQSALKLKPAEAYPKEKVAEIKGVLAKMAEQARMDKQYQETLARADQSFTGKLYPKARTDYEAALALRPGESYPKTRIASIDSIMGAMAAAKALDEQYRATIVKADQLLAGKTYDQARVEYVKAGNLKPEEEYPRTKISEIDRLVADAAARKALDEQYAGLITKADQQMADKQYEVARTTYQEASGLKPSEAYPKTKIAAIDQLLGAMAAQRLLDDNYSSAIKKGDSLLAGQIYQGALDAYQSALKLKPAEAYPKEKVAEINGVLAKMAEQARMDKQYQETLARADQSFTGKLYPKARTDYEAALALRPGESYPKTRIASIDSIMGAMAAAKALDEQYRATIVKADQLLAAKTYDQARVEYVKAGNLKPEEEYPRTKISEIDRLVADAAARKALDEQYAGLIAKADQQMADKHYEVARTTYQEASGLKPSESYPKTKIAAIDKLLEEIAFQKRLNEQYTGAIQKGDSLFGAKLFEPAKAEFVTASNLKPTETYPKTKISEIDGFIAAANKSKELENRYRSAVQNADKLFAEKQYDLAMAAYQEAGKIKPAEQYPQDQLKAISAKLKELTLQKELDEKYTAAVNKGDQNFTKSSYEQALVEYESALKLKPQEKYPADKISEINGILEEIKVRETHYNTTLLTADGLLAQKKYEEARTAYQNALTIKPDATYPKEKLLVISKALEELLGKQKLYENLLTSGDGQIREKDFIRAKETFSQAQTLFPEEKYPRDRLNFITYRLDSIFRANKALYDKAVANGDRYYTGFEFDKAIDAFTQASELLPGENYPREMIVKIRRTIAENTIADVLKTPVVIESGAEKQFSFSPVNIAARKNNFIYLKLRNLSGKPFNVMMRYGKDKQPNGGVVVRNVSGDGKINERLVSVKDQDLWYRADNNWISLYPQGGDVEVSFIQVSRAK